MQPHGLVRRLLSRRAWLATLLVAFTASTAQATWSIIAVNRRTKEICVASATCLANFDLRQFLPVVAVGKGAGCAQSFVDQTGTNRIAIWNGLRSDNTAANILQVLQQIDPNFQTRQYGIIDMATAPVTFTGTGAGLAKFGVAGIDGDISYAIQGNVLTGNQVISDAEAAFLGLQGDLTSRVMAAMEAARALGGDGRCSCSPSAPTSCGVPPASFSKSAHVGFLIDARLGDVDGVCNGSVGCATGSYTLNLNVIGNTFDLDPVIQLASQYQAWRTSRLGRPDGIQSLVYVGAQCLPADGLSATTVDVQAVDIEGLPVTQGGATVTLTNVSGFPAVTTPSGILDHGNGLYSFALQAGTTPGEDQWQVRIDDGVKAVTIAPYVKMRVDAPVDLHCGFDEVSVSRDTFVPLTVNLGPAAAGRRYWILMSAAGTQPGTVFQGVHMPLNADGYFRFSAARPNSLAMVNTLGILDNLGYASAGFQTWQNRNFAALLGRRLDFSALVWFGPNPVPTSTGGFDVKP
ncbi:MAG: DUF1028 domain-containing protein [Planctomycetes bacterium]|nr:DUF1028 domain-containing protein [Planctomycetota bacterium]